MIPRRTLNSLATVAGAVVCNAAFLPAAYSQYSHCDAAWKTRDPGTLKLVVNDLLQIKDSDPDALTEKDWNDIQQSLNFRINELRRGSEPDAYRFLVIHCPESKPADPAEIGKQVVADLNQKNVIALIWGNAGQSTIRFYQIVVPSHMEKIIPALNTLPIHRGNKAARELLLSLSGDTQTARAFDAYFALAVGVKLSNKGNYGPARSYLCLALARFKRVDGVPKNVEPYIEQKLMDIAAKDSQMAVSDRVSTLPVGSDQLARIVDPKVLVPVCDPGAK